MDLLLDSTGDVFIGSDGSMSLTSSIAQAVAQRLQLKLDSQFGSWFLDAGWGVRYIDTDGDESTILIKSPNIPAIVSELKSIIIDTEDVIRIVSFEQTFTPSERSFSVEFEVEVDGSDLVEGVVLVGDGATALFAPEGSAIAVTTVRVSPCRG